MLQRKPDGLPDPEDCVFYHVMDLPGLGVVGTGWDLRDTVGAYLGNVDFHGKRVLDIGTASGFLSFETERRGAEVVSFDMASGENWDVVPFRNERYDEDSIRKHKVRGFQRLENGYWYAHHVLKSRAERIVGNVYNHPQDLGTYDIVILGMILPHLRDPFLALAAASERCMDTLIVTQQTIKSQDPIMKFLPDPATNSPTSAWWVMSDALMKRWFDLLGFELIDQVVEKHLSTVRGRAVPCTAFVGRKR